MQIKVIWSTTSHLLAGYYSEKVSKTQMLLTRMWKNWETCVLLIRVQSATVKNSMKIPKKTKRGEHSTSGHRPKDLRQGCEGRLCIIFNS